MTDYPHETSEKTENISHNNNYNNTKGFPRTVTTVTASNTSKIVDYNIITDIPDNLYQLYERGDIWCCKNCNQRGDKWYMLKHNCKMNRK
ncbi:MAG: hypothetical protein ABJB73_12785 [Candidatus Nitrosocosmicus sp.]